MLDLIEMGMQRESCGDLGGALEYYSRFLELEPLSGRGQFCLGNVLVALGRYEEALVAFDGALEAKPESVGAHFNRGDVCERLGRLADAESAYQRALEIDPAFSDALVGLGNVYESMGRRQNAIDCYRQAIALNPDRREVYRNLVISLQASGSVDETQQVLHDVIARFPDDCDAHYSLAELLAKEGCHAAALEHLSVVTSRSGESVDAYALQGDVFLQTGRTDEAIVSYMHALAVGGEDLRILNNLGSAQRQIGLLEDSASTFRRAIELTPDFVEALSNLGAVLKTLGRIDDALGCFRQAVAANPEFDEAYHNMGLALSEIGKYDEALRCYSRAIEINPDRFESLSNLGAMYTFVGKLEQAQDCFSHLLERRPGSADAYVGLGVVMKDYGRLDEAIRYIKEAIKIDPELTAAYSILLFSSHYLSDVSHSDLLDYAKRFGALVRKKATTFETWEVVPSPDRPLRIGIVSGDLGKHPVGCFLVGVLEALVARYGDRLSFHAYVARLHEDSLSERLKQSFSTWFPAAGLSDEGLARRIHSDRIDILIDLSGHSAFNRLPVFAWRPAPVQVTWLGYFATTGVSEMDYVIADSWTLPECETQFFTEKVWRLPETRLCFSLPEEDVSVSLLPALTNGYVTFGCFNNLSKLTPEVISIWAVILHQVPGSRLILKALQFSDPSVRGVMMERFSALDIGAERLMLEPYEDRDRYLSSYHRVDVGLDPFPYTGGTTTVESLWMGVPVITLEGDHFLSRQGVGLLGNAGLPDWIAADTQSYVAKAVASAKDLSSLALLRSQLRSQVQKSPIFDADRFSVGFERALRGMWEAWCQNKTKVGESTCETEPVVNT